MSISDGIFFLFPENVKPGTTPQAKLCHIVAKQCIVKLFGNFIETRLNARPEKPFIRIIAKSEPATKLKGKCKISIIGKFIAE